MMQGYSDEQIIAWLSTRATADRGMRAVIHQYGERLYAQARQITQSHPDADDVLQQALMKIYAGIDRFNREAKLYTWMYRIVTHEAISYMRSRQRRRSKVVAGDLTELSIQARSEDPVVYERAEILLVEAVEKLPRRQRQVWEMRYGAEMSYADIAEQTGLSVGSLKASFHHAANKIKDYIRTHNSL